MVPSKLQEEINDMITQKLRTYLDTLEEEKKEEKISFSDEDQKSLELISVIIEEETKWGFKLGEQSDIIKKGCLETFK